MTITCLSIRQPWAWAILFAGKRCENRTWFCRYRGPIYIHAAKGMTRDEYESFAYWWQWEFPGRRPLQTYPALPEYDAMQRGGIVGRAKIIDCIRSQHALPFGITREKADRYIVPWWQGPVGIILAEVEPLPFVACKGKLGLFELDDAILDGTADGQSVAA